MDGLVHRIDDLSPARRRLLALCLEEEGFDLSWLMEQRQAPCTPLEAELAAIWKDVLGVERVGIHDNFFDLGGDSILSIRIVAKANRLGLKLTSRQLFEHPTISALAGLVERANPAPQVLSPAPSASASPHRQLSPADFPDAELTDDDLRKILTKASQLVVGAPASSPVLRHEARQPETREAVSMAWSGCAPAMPEAG